MRDLTSLDNELDAKNYRCRAIMETPKGSRSKFKYDPESGLFKLGQLLPDGLVFPIDFGFLPSTIGDDGDPLDMMVFMDAPTHVGCLTDARIIGILEANQTEDGRTVKNDRLLGVAVHSYNYQDVSSIREMDKSVLNHVEEFFLSYNKQRGKKFKITGVGGPTRAVQFLKKGIQLFKKKQSSLPS